MWDVFPGIELRVARDLQPVVVNEFEPSRVGVHQKSDCQQQQQSCSVAEPVPAYREGSVRLFSGVRWHRPSRLFAVGTIVGTPARGFQLRKREVGRALQLTAKDRVHRWAAWGGVFWFALAQAASCPGQRPRVRDDIAPVGRAPQYPEEVAVARHLAPQATWMGVSLASVPATVSSSQSFWVSLARVPVL